MIKYTPIGFTVDLTRHDFRKRKAIFDNKCKILKIAESVNDKYFLISDLDIIYGYGIQEMEKFLNDNLDYGAVALYPHGGKIPDNRHVSAAFMMIRTEAIKGIELEYRKNCFCHSLREELMRNDWKVTYIEGKVIHP